MWRIAGILFLTGMVVLAGCDFGADEETITLNDEALFRFQFNADDVERGEPFTVTSTGTESVQQYLASQGYTLEQLIAARVTDGVAEVLFPLDASVQFMNSIAIRFSADTALTGVVAELTEIPPEATSDTIDLVVYPSTDTAPPMRFGGFSAEMDLVTNETLRAGESYELAVQFQVALDVLYE